MLQNHGALCFGATVAEAWVRYYHLELACRTQLSALAAAAGVAATSAKPSAAAGDILVVPDSKTVLHAAGQYEGDSRPGKYEWAALLRLAGRLQAAHPAHRRGVLAWLVG